GAHLYHAAAHEGCSVARDEVLRGDCYRALGGNVSHIHPRLDGSVGAKGNKRWGVTAHSRGYRRVIDVKQGARGNHQSVPAWGAVRGRVVQPADGMWGRRTELQNDGAERVTESESPNQIRSHVDRERDKTSRNSIDWAGQIEGAELEGHLRPLLAMLLAGILLAVALRLALLAAALHVAFDLERMVNRLWAYPCGVGHVGGFGLLVCGGFQSHCSLTFRSVWICASVRSSACWLRIRRAS